MRILTPFVAVVSLICMTNARADEIFRKGGEWRATVTGVGPQPRTMVLCFSQATWEQAMTRSAAGKTCAKRNFSRSGNQVTVDIDCGTYTAQGTATLSGDNAYTSDLTMRLGAGDNAKVFHSVTEAKWIGECKPGEKAF